MDKKDVTKDSKSEYNKMLEDTIKIIQNSRIKAYRFVNKELLGMYIKIGEIIHERQERLGWGKSVVERLSKDLQSSFPGIRGFSVQNLWYMKRIYETYSEDEKLQPLVGEIPWSHHLIIIDKTKTRDEREFYIKMTIKHHWTKRVLAHQIASDLYKRALTSKKDTNYTETLPASLDEEALEIFKDEYVLDFLEITDDMKEKELEHQILENLKNFLLELGRGFTFVGSQYRITVSKRDYFIDLLFYHRQLRCLIPIELKIGEFKPEYVGKMDFYLNVLDDNVRLPEENQSIGIILCREKDDIIVEYALRDSTKPIGVAVYRMKNEMPETLAKALPSPDEMRKRLLKKLDQEP